MTDFSNEIAGTFFPGPAAPVLLKIEGDGKPAVASVQLPTTAKDGSPLTVLKSVAVFYKKSTMEGSTPEAEMAAGTPFVSFPVTPALAGQTLQIDVDGLEWGPEYFFRADCN